MAKGYAEDLRVRVVALVEAGESRREAARLLDVGASSAVRWLERWTTTGSVAAKPGTGHCRSPLEAHKQWLLELVWPTAWSARVNSTPASSRCGRAWPARRTTSAAKRRAA